MPTEVQSEKTSHTQAQILHRETFLAWAKAGRNWSFARFMLSRGHQEYEQYLQPTQEALENAQRAWEAAELAFILTGVEESIKQQLAKAMRQIAQNSQFSATCSA